MGPAIQPSTKKKKKKKPGTSWFPGTRGSALKGGEMPIRLKFFQISEEKGILPNSFCEASFALTQARSNANDRKWRTISCGTQTPNPKQGASEWSSARQKKLTHSLY